LVADPVTAAGFLLPGAKVDDDAAADGESRRRRLSAELTGVLLDPAAALCLGRGFCDCDAGAGVPESAGAVTGNSVELEPTAAVVPAVADE